ncbi:MAG: hypothetical protein EI684_04825 [Candidatus Viridilinea halotolerans]|uniref:Uncharacterized protein n=1 Tax=Candidatus Viridilinea halotolerans TaxID=2491704 RepID=A0A426U5T9_9CHLR|nr:MAG: hypothetical protein EI684_04825 [Candidatus Viridilinea halotolerans]
MSVGKRAALTTLDALCCDEQAALLALAHTGGMTTGQLQTICWRERSRRTAQQGLSRMEHKGLIVQHHRSVHSQDRTYRLPSLWELVRRGAGLVRKHPLSPENSASLAGRTLERAERLGAVVVALVSQTPELAGLCVTLHPSIHPDQPRHGNSDALLFLHRWLTSLEATDQPSTTPWLPTMDFDSYRGRALLIELDDGLSASGLRCQAERYARPRVWRNSTLGEEPLPLWVLSDPQRRNVIARNFGSLWGERWLSVAIPEIQLPQWTLWEGAKIVRTSSLGAVLDVC